MFRNDVRHRFLPLGPYQSPKILISIKVDGPKDWSIKVESTVRFKNWASTNRFRPFNLKLKTVRFGLKVVQLSTDRPLWRWFLLNNLCDHICKNFCIDSSRVNLSKWNSSRSINFSSLVRIIPEISFKPRPANPDIYHAIGSSPSGAGCHPGSNDSSTSTSSEYWLIYSRLSRDNHLKKPPTP